MNTDEVNELAARRLCAAVWPTRLEEWAMHAADRVFKVPAPDRGWRERVGVELYDLGLALQRRRARRGRHLVAQHRHVTKAPR